MLAGEIKLPVVRIETSQKAARGVMLTDLTAYIDRQYEKAVVGPTAERRGVRYNKMERHVRMGEMEDVEIFY